MPRKEDVSGFHDRCFSPKIFVRNSHSFQILNEKIAYQKTAIPSGMTKIEI